MNSRQHFQWNFSQYRKCTKHGDNNKTIVVHEQMHSLVNATYVLASILVQVMNS